MQIYVIKGCLQCYTECTLGIDNILLQYSLGHTYTVQFLKNHNNCYRAHPLPLLPVRVMLPRCPGHGEHGHQARHQHQAHSRSHNHPYHDVDQHWLKYKLMLMFAPYLYQEDILVYCEKK